MHFLSELCTKKPVVKFFENFFGHVPFFKKMNTPVGAKVVMRNQKKILGLHKKKCFSSLKALEV